MVKKISAILLALVICLSVVVVPASAAVDLGDATIAFALEWDKDNYSAGETAYLSIYMDAADDIELTTGSFLIALNSSVFSTTDNPIATVKENAVTTDWFESFWKPASTQLSWLTNATQVGYVTDDCTEEEKANYDMYLKYTGGKNNQNGWHENCASTKNGFSGSEFIADEPIMTIALVVREDVADGTAVRAAIVSGSTTTQSGNPQTHWKYLKSPGTSTSTANVASTAVSVSQAIDDNAVIGAAGKEYEPSIVSFNKEQIRMDKADNSEFSIRHIAVIEKSVWESTFGTDEDAQAEGTKNIKSIGFLYSTSATLDKDTATDALEAVTDVTTLAVGTSLGDGIVAAPVDYVSTGVVSGYYAYTCVVTGITNPANTLSTLGYVVWEDAAGTTHYSYFEDVYSNSFETLYNGYIAAH